LIAPDAGTLVLPNQLDAGEVLVCDSPATENGASVEIIG
jgi:hypothetical protein